MNRKITYFVNDNEVSEERYKELLQDENNLSTLTIKYEPVDTEYLLKEIDSLKKKITELETERLNNWWWDRKNPFDYDDNVIKISQPFTNPYPWTQAVYSCSCDCKKY